MGESKRELAIRMLKENACMFNSCLVKDELKHFKNYDFVQYLINRLSIPEHNYDNCHNATCKRKSRKDGYEQAVDDFAEKLLWIIDNYEEAENIGKRGQGTALRCFNSEKEKEKIYNRIFNSL
mgnify:CR=1 FL=1